MLNQLYFHEKCNEDVKQILTHLKKGHRANEFINALIETYQHVFESPNYGNIIFRTSYSFQNERKCIAVTGFPYIIVFVKLAHAKIVVLNIIYCVKAMTHY